MRKKLQYLLTILLMVTLIVLVSGCKKSTEVPPDPPEPPIEPPVLTEQLVAKMYYHDTGPQSQYDIFTADLYIVPKQTTSAQLMNRIETRGPGKSLTTLKPGISKLHNLEFNGSIKERVVINSLYATQDNDISKYDFEVKNVENLTQSTFDDFAVNVNGNDWITFVTAPKGLAVDRNNTEIVYMDTGDRVRHQLT
ncbi:MAG: hypothetical protein GY950_16380, partial [bacterium]|nr:hypothetical protein [bacterium]